MADAAAHIRQKARRHGVQLLQPGRRRGGADQQARPGTGPSRVPRRQRQGRRDIPRVASTDEPPQQRALPLQPHHPPPHQAPPQSTLPDPVLNLGHVSGKATVSKLILSSASPASQECRAMVSYGQDDRLAFCCPGHSHEWVPIGKPYMDRENKTFNLVYPKSYDDFVYSTKSNVLTCLTKSALHETGLEDWDLTDMDSPKLAWIRTDNDSPSGLIGDEYLKEEHLAYAEGTDELFLVSRFINKRQHKTEFFSTYKIIKEEDGWMSLRKCSSSDLAWFLGTNHAFAISHFNPNSIYFTHHKHHHQHQPDVGIYHHYDDRILSNCYYPLHHTNTTNAVPAPIWFTPTLA